MLKVKQISFLSRNIRKTAMIYQILFSFHKSIIFNKTKPRSECIVYVRVNVRDWKSERRWRSNVKTSFSLLFWGMRIALQCSEREVPKKYLELSRMSLGMPLRRLSRVNLILLYVQSVQASVPTKHVQLCNWKNSFFLSPNVDRWSLIRLYI